MPTASQQGRQHAGGLTVKWRSDCGSMSKHKKEVSVSSMQSWQGSAHTRITHSVLAAFGTCKLARRRGGAARACELKAGGCSVRGGRMDCAGGAAGGKTELPGLKKSA